MASLRVEASGGEVLANSNGLRIFDGAVAIVTGGASGIGEALGQELATRGCIVLLADLQIDLAEKVGDRINQLGGNAQAVELDVTDFGALHELVTETAQRHGRLDYMFNNAGIGIGGEAGKYEIEDWTRLIDVNLVGVVNGVQAAYGVMCEQGFGHIVNTASVAGLVPAARAVNYATTKHAVVGLSTSLRIAAELEGVRVSVLCPGIVDTPILTGGRYGKLPDGMTAESIGELMKKRRPISADEFARKAVPQIARNKAIIVVPAFYRVLWWIYRARPDWELALSRKVYVRHLTKSDRT